MMVATMGNRRTAVSVTASAAPASVAPRASWSISTTWLGRANMLSDRKAVWPSVKPLSRASAPKPSAVANSTKAATE